MGYLWIIAACIGYVTGHVSNPMQNIIFNNIYLFVCLFIYHIAAAHLYRSDALLSFNQQYHSIQDKMS